MAWVKVPPENHPRFLAALPDDPRVESRPMFGGIAARVNGHVFAGLFGRSTMLLLSDADKGEALALEGAGMFDPMGDGRRRSDKVMLPEAMMQEPALLRRWIARAFAFAAALPPKEPPAKAGATKAASRKPAAKKPAARKPAAATPAATKPAGKKPTAPRSPRR